jgi:ribosomal protein L37AE/L43A
MIRFSCPSCEEAARVDVSKPVVWQCPHCDHRLELPAGPPAQITDGKCAFANCLICANAELYKKKAFPHWLGLLILTLACAAFLVLNALRLYLFAWIFLLGSALLDGALYLLVGDVIVCYRCGAHHPCSSAAAAHAPFELIIGERYRQEKLRREQLR